MTMPKKDTTNDLDDALFAANELLSIQVAADWPDSKPINNGLDDLTFGHLRVLRDAALTTAPNQQPVSAAFDLLELIKAKQCAYFLLSELRFERADVQVENAHRFFTDYLDKVSRQALAQAGVPDGYVLVPKDAGHRLGEAFLRALFGPEFDTPFAERLTTLLETADKLAKPDAPVSAKEG
jgi:hypothetical protein